MGERGGHSGRECSVGIKKQSKLSFLGLVFDYHFFLSSGVWIKNDIKSKKCCLVFFLAFFSFGHYRLPVILTVFCPQVLIDSGVQSKVHSKLLGPENT